MKSSPKDTAELYNKIVALNDEIQKDLSTLKTQQDDEETESQNGS